MVDRHEIPEEWKDSLAELTRRRIVPEDDEDRLIREGGAAFAAMSPEEQARVRRHGDELLAQMQTSENREAVGQAFRQAAGSD